MNNLKYYLSIIIPAFNEEKRIIDSLESIVNYLFKQDYSSEIIVVNDGSTDNTALMVNEFFKNKNNKIDYSLINLNKNKGKGYAVRKGFIAAKGELILFTDSDLSTPIQELEMLIPYIENDYDVAIGSRGLDASVLIKKQAKLRMYMGKFFNLIVRKFTKLEFLDTQCGFKLFKAKNLKAIIPQLRINDFSFDVEILFLAKKYGLKIIEVPIAWKNSANSKVKIFKDPFKMSVNLIKIIKFHK